ncbi:NfeD family protein [Piscinibacter sp.]|uniref:NfeD family protein n=1 Tax=Piscinibacter sp. TaxID=1903157 RepID=UPI002BC10494|nr:nodulation protein NfeD [Albitalea sp.]HUG26158.1 nodulation protein NfeD [Albitalea sp.]
MNVIRWIGLPFVLALAVLGSFAPARAQDKPPAIIYVVPIEGIIDLGLAPFVQRVLDEATQAGAAAVVLDINTFGGRVDAAVQIRDSLLNARIRTVAFVNKRAISAGALISLAAQNIVMSPGGTIGAATPVQGGAPGAEAQPTSEKAVSYVRKEFRATAESRKRPLLIAEAMVDADVAIRGLVDKGKLLTLTTEEALQHKVSDFSADTLESALEKLGLGGAELRRVGPNWAENVVRFLTNPVVSSLLISIAMLGILVEIRTPGFGIPGALGVTSLGLFFWGHWLVQLAGWEELLLAVAGVILLAIEVLVIPGFGVAGVLGIAAILAGLVLSMVGPGDTPAFIVEAAGRVVLSLVFALLASLMLLRLIPSLPFGRRLVLARGLESAQGYASAPEGDAALLGKTGRAWSPLRPSGIAEIDGRRVDVVSDGELVDAGESIEVTRVDGNRIVVRRTTNLNQKE